MISLSTYVLKQDKMFSNTIWEAPTQNKIIPNEQMIHFQFIHLVKSLSDLINVICGKNFYQGHWRKCSNFCIKYINVCQASIKLFLFLLFAKRYHISLTMKVHQVHHPQNHMAYMYIILYECQAVVNNSQ